jgi:hypothetical protein
VTFDPTRAGASLISGNSIRSHEYAVLQRPTDIARSPLLPLAPEESLTTVTEPAYRLSLNA